MILGQNAIESKVDVLNEKAWQVSTNNPIEAIKLSSHALQLADSVGYLKGISTSNNYLGIFHTDLSRFQEAETYFLKTIEVRKKMGYWAGVAYVLDNMCRLKKDQGDYLEAIRCGFQAIEILTSLGKEREEPTLFLNLAIAHHFNQDTSDAIKYYQEGLDIASELADTNNMALIHFNFGNFYRELIQYDSAEHHLKNALQLFEATNYKGGEAAVYDALGAIFTEDGNPEQARALFNESIDINKDLKDSLRLFHNYLYLARLYQKQDDYKNALAYCDTAEVMLLNIDRKEELEQLNRLYSEIYAALEDFDRAYYFLANAEQLKNSIFNEEKNRSILKLQKENAEREKAEAEIEVQKEEIKNQRLSGGIGFLALISFFGLYLLNQRRIKNRRELIAYKERQERIIDRRIIDATQSIRKELSYNLHNHVSTPLTHIKRYLEPVFKQFSFDKNVQSNLAQALQIVDKTHVLSRDIAYKLKPEKINWIERIKLSLKALEKKDKVTTDFIVNELDEKSFSKVQGEKISSVIGNLLNNADMHSGASNVKVAIKQANGSLNIKVEDNGKGFDPVQERGIGLESIETYIQELEGSIDIKSEKNKGTHIKITIPVSHE